MRHILYSLAFAAILLSIYACFSPGLSGPILLDDRVQIPRLGDAQGAIDTPTEVINFTLSFSVESPTGRPLSMLSLLINDNAWPSTTPPFKRTNLLIHLLNTVLVFAFVLKLSPLLTKQKGQVNYWIALTTALIWGLHPFHLSPVMMIIQRMTLLSGTFTLCALLCYLTGRIDYASKPIAAHIWLFIAAGFFILLAVLSKETGIMVAAYFFALEATLFRSLNLPRPRLYRLWFATFILIPFAILLAYAFISLSEMQALYVKRDYGAIERLLTQSRVIIDYATRIIFPSLAGSGPYHDDYAISRTLTDPPSTFLATATILTASLLAIKARTSAPVLALSVFWFLGGHLLESTVLPLELYFEHRNYLPMLGLQIALIVGLAKIIATSNRKITCFAQISLIAYIALEGLISYNAALTWGDSVKIGTIWAAEHPGSFRAQSDAMSLYLASGREQKAIETFNTITTHHPSDAGMPLLAHAINQCQPAEKAIFPIAKEQVLNLLPSAPFSHTVPTTIRLLTEKHRDGRCRIFSRDIQDIIAATLENQRYYTIPSARYNIHIAEANLYIHSRDLNQAIRALDDAYNAMPLYEARIAQAQLLLSAGLPEDALDFVQKAKDAPVLRWYLKTVQHEKIRQTEIAARQALAPERWAPTQP